MASAAASYHYPHNCADAGDLTNAFHRMNPNSVPVTSTPNNPSSKLCVVCLKRPQYNRNRRSYPTCGLTCASRLQQGGPLQHGSTYSTQPPGLAAGQRRGIILGVAPSSQAAMPSSAPTTAPVSSGPSVSSVRPDRIVCVVCKTRFACRDYVTCGFTCKERLYNEGGDPTMCNYCHQHPRLPGEEQCSDACAALAREACLLCKCRPRNGFYHLCGNRCKEIVARSGILILEVVKGHSTFSMVEDKFREAWKSGVTSPAIKKVFRVIESDDAGRPYNAYRNRVGNEQHRYHGTKKTCQLGTSTTKLCSSPACPACNILRTSFKTCVGNAGGAFGQGVYTSSASNKSYNYTSGGTGALLVTKVALGRAYSVNQFAAVRGCPPGFNSVVFDRNGGSLNETVVYRDDAIRPVFLITF